MQDRPNPLRDLALRSVVCLPALLAATSVSAQFTAPYSGVGPAVRSGPLPIVVMKYEPNTPFDYERTVTYGRSGSTLLEIAKDRDSTWYKRLAIPFVGGLSPADDPVPFRNPDGSVASIFVLGSDGRIYQNTTRRYDAFGTWGGWSALPSNVLMSSSAVAVNTPDGLGVSTFAIGRDGHLYNAFFSRGTGGGWGNWAMVPGSPTFIGRPAVENSSDGLQLHAMATDTAGTVRHVRFVRGGSGGWTSWQSLSGTLVGSPSSYVLGSLLSIFGVGTSGQIHQAVYSNGSWGSWSSLGRPSTGSFVGNPAAVNSPDGGSLDVIGRTTSGTIEKRTYTRGGGGWSSWAPLDMGGALTSGPTLTNWHSRTATTAQTRQQFFGADQSVQRWFGENSFGRFPVREAYISNWLTMPDDPNTPVDESSYEYFHGADMAGKARLMIQAFEGLTGFRFANYDTNRDGKVTTDELMVFWLYPGESARVRGVGGCIPVPSLSGCGVELSLGLPRAAAHIDPATICEELCHALFGLDDLYATPDLPNYVDPGRLTLISNNAAFPHLHPWGKMKLGWVPPTVVTQDGWYRLRPIEQYQDLLVVHDPGRGTDDYLLVENRWPDGSIEATLPDRGIGVWRVSEYFAGQPDRDRKTLHLLRAGGGTDDSLAFWDASDLRTAYHLTPNSSPESTRWYDNTSSQIAIYHVSKAGSTVQMFVDVPPLRSAPPPPYLPAGFRYVDQKAPYQNPNPNLLTGMSVPQIGTDFRVRVPFSYLGSTFVSHFLLTGLQNPNFSLPAVFRGYVYASTDLVLPTPLGASGQYTEIKLGIPLDFGLVGLDFYQQVARTAPGMSPPYLLSRGIHGTIGN
ncbi:MAG: hypothetical protein KDC87_01005 [Planctomycetes bacterium]|nr:hypothetical protein [Planctomycetota bacterium]